MSDISITFQHALHYFNCNLTKMTCLIHQKGSVSTSQQHTTVWNVICIILNLRYLFLRFNVEILRNVWKCFILSICVAVAVHFMYLLLCRKTYSWYCLAVMPLYFMMFYDGAHMSVCLFERVWLCVWVHVDECNAHLCSIFSIAIHPRIQSV